MKKTLIVKALSTTLLTSEEVENIYINASHVSSTYTIKRLCESHEALRLQLIKEKTDGMSKHGSLE